MRLKYSIRVIATLALAVAAVQAGAAIKIAAKSIETTSENGPLATTIVPASLRSETKAYVVAGDGSASGEIRSPARSEADFQRTSDAFGANLKLAPSAVPSIGEIAAVPEPGKWATLLAGLLGVGAIARRRLSSS